MMPEYGGCQESSFGMIALKASNFTPCPQGTRTPTTNFQTPLSGRLAGNVAILDVVRSWF